MWVTFSLPRISTRPLVSVVFPVAESPTTPRMIGRAMLRSPLSVSSKRGTLLPEPIFYIVCVTKSRAAAAALTSASAHAQQRREPQQRDDQRGQRGAAAHLAYEVGLPRREVAAVVAVARGADRWRRRPSSPSGAAARAYWRTICGPTVPGSRSTSCIPGGASTAENETAKPSANSAPASCMAPGVAPIHGAERDEHERDAGDDEPRPPAPPALPGVPRRGQHERHREQRQQQRRGQPRAAPQRRRTRAARGAARARTAAATSRRRTAARPRPPAAGS